MSAAAEGRKINKTVDDVTSKARQGVRPGDAVVASEDGTMIGANFPMHYDAGTKEWDKVTALKQAMVTDPTTAMTPFGRLQFSDRDAEALLRKEEAMKDAMFDQWFAENWNKADLPTRRLAQELNPGFYARQEATMIERAKLALRIKLMELRGPSNDPEDLRILFGLQTGEIQLQEGWDRIGDAGVPASARAVRADIASPTQLFRPNPVVDANAHPGNSFFNADNARRANRWRNRMDMFPGLRDNPEPRYNPLRQLFQ